MKAQLERMGQAMAWADRQMLAELSDCPAAWAEAGGLCGHVLAAEHVWLARMLRQDPTVAVWPTLTPPECATLAAENAAGWATFLASRSDADLGEMISYRNQRGEDYVTAVIDIVTHVVIHGAYHRGQIAKMVARAGGTSINTDYIMWLRSEGK
jgi:uncharacterized damage-inducible protein DinB